MADNNSNWLALGGSAIGGIANAITGANQDRRNRRMMDIQFNNQKALNQQAHDLNMEQFRQTGPAAQRNMMMEAGLNPALMYGMSGGGTGQAGGQGGGSAASSQATMLDAGLMMQGAKLASEIELIDAQKDKTQAETDTISGTNERGKGEIEKIKTEIANTAMDTQSKEKYMGIMDSIQGLNIAKANEAMAKASIDKNTVEWMKKTGLNPNDSQLAKSIKYLSDQTGTGEKDLIEMAIWIYGAGQAGKFFNNIFNKQNLNFKKGKKIGY